MRLNQLNLVLAVALFATLGAGTTNGQDGFYDNLILGSGDPAETPSIRFDQGDDNNWIVGRPDELQFFVVDGYKFRIFDSAYENGLLLDGQGARVVGNVRADGYKVAGDGTSQLFIDVNHSDTGQSFGLSSLSSNSGLYGGGVGLSTENAYYPLWVFGNARNETLTMNFDGVAIGSYDPESALHVYADGNPFAEAKVTVENDLGGAPVQREMFELINNGGSRFAFTDTSRGSKWIFASDTLGRFSVSLDGTGGPEFTIRPDGRVLMGAGPTRNFDLRTNGDLHIAGTLYQSSDRTKKTAFRSIDQEDVLKKVAEMPITTWQYKSDDETMRHMGPMSQDFRAAFGLGESEKTISTIDGIGVSLAAIQALNAKMRTKDEQIAELEERLETQEDRLEQVMQRLEALATEQQQK